MEKSSQIAWKLVPLRSFFPLNVVPLIEVKTHVQPISQISPNLSVHVINARYRKFPRRRDTYEGGNSVEAHRIASHTCLVQRVRLQGCDSSIVIVIVF
jgi:hypothetical protein